METVEDMVRSGAVTGVTEEVRALTGLDHGALATAAAHVAPGCDGLLWLPFLMGERVPDLPHATGTLLGLQLPELRGRSNPLAREHSLFCSAFVVHVLRQAGVDPLPGHRGRIVAENGFSVIVPLLQADAFASA